MNVFPPLNFIFCDFPNEGVTQDNNDQMYVGVLTRVLIGWAADGWLINMW